MLRNIYLEGELGEVFIPHLEMDCDTTSEVFKCLEANFPNFKSYFLKKHEEGAFLHIETAGEELEYEEEVLMEVGPGDIIITPLPAGSKAAVKLVIGAILVVVGVVVALGGSPLLGYAIAMVGASLAISGLMELMAPDPSVDKQEAGQESYLFNGSAQSIVSGDPVPVLYGRLRVPGQPAGFEIIGETATYSDGAGLHGADGVSILGAGVSGSSTGNRTIDQA